MLLPLDFKGKVMRFLEKTRQGIGFVLAGASLLAAVGAEASSSKPASTLSDWVGNYASLNIHTKTILPNNLRLWADPKIVKSLTAAIPSKENKKIISCWGGDCDESPIWEFNNFLVIDSCKKSECDKVSTRVFLDRTSGEVFVCEKRMVFFNNGQGVVSHSWWENGKQEYLSRGDCEDLPSRKKLEKVLKERRDKEFSFFGEENTKTEP